MLEVIHIYSTCTYTNSRKLEEVVKLALVRKLKFVLECKVVLWNSACVEVLRSLGLPRFFTLWVSTGSYVPDRTGKLWDRHALALTSSSLISHRDVGEEVGWRC
jgi:hypothetical protein